MRERVLRFNWRLAIARILVNAAALGLAVLLLPGVRIVHENVLLILLASGLIFGALNAIVRPILQFIMFNFLFATFGLVLIFINFILLWLLGKITPGWFQADRWYWLLLAAILVGLFGVIFENLLGLSPPIVDDPDIEPVTNDAIAKTFESLLESHHQPSTEDDVQTS